MQEKDSPIRGISRAGFLRRTGALTIGAATAGTVLAGCGSSDAPASTPTAAASASSASGGKIADKFKRKTIGIVHLTSADENEASLAKALKEAAKSAGLNWKFIESDSQGDQGKAQAATAGFVNQKVDAIIPMVVAARLISKELGDAKSAGIPVFGEWTFSELNPLITVDYTPIPAADASALAQYMFSDLQTRKPGQAPIKVALLDTDIDILQGRSVTVRGIKNLYPRVQIVDTANVDTKDINGSSSQIAQSFMSKHSDLDAIWTNYPPTGPGAASAVEQRGKASSVGVYAHVAQSAGFNALKRKDSALRAMSWVDLDWQSYHLVGLMLEHFAGKSPQRLASYQEVVPFRVFDNATVAEANGEGTAAGRGWTQLNGIWKQPLVDSWKGRYS